MFPRDFNLSSLLMDFHVRKISDHSRKIVQLAEGWKTRVNFKNSVCKSATRRRSVLLTSLQTANQAVLSSFVLSRLFSLSSFSSHFFSLTLALTDLFIIFTFRSPRNDIAGTNSSDKLFFLTKNYSLSVNRAPRRITTLNLCLWFPETSLSHISIYSITSLQNVLAKCCRKFLFYFLKISWLALSNCCHSNS